MGRLIRLLIMFGPTIYRFGKKFFASQKAKEQELAENQRKENDILRKDA